MSGGKGGSQTSKVQIPSWIEEPSIRNIARAEQVARMGYQPYYGPEVAAFSPMQQQAMQSQYDAAAAFGLAPMGGNAMAGMPAPTGYAGGIQGYGSGDLFEQAVNEFQKRQPDQAALYASQFVGPDVNAINTNSNPNPRPVMVGGGEGGGNILPSNIINSNPMTGTYGDAFVAPVGGFNQGPFGQTIPTMPPMPTSGPFVASGVGAINPITGMTDGVGGVSGGGVGKGGRAPTSEAIPDWVSTKGA